MLRTSLARAVVIGVGIAWSWPSTTLAIGGLSPGHQSWEYNLNGPTWTQLPTWPGETEAGYVTAHTSRKPSPL
ncbi:MAG: hypothetical protein HY905_25635 [Deltaproteobacteria bacterium]|nr:hypothetical protein [Deltaproteobacteria bacterium]